MGQQEDEVESRTVMYVVTLPSLDYQTRHAYFGS
jgi:hypothetical protein